MGNVRYCLMCLGTEMKMFQMNSSMLKTYNELITTRCKLTSIALHACYECAYLLTKYDKFKSKCHRAYNILWILSNGSFEVTEENVKRLDRKQNKLESSLLFTPLLTTDHYPGEENCLDENSMDREIETESYTSSIEEQYKENIMQSEEKIDPLLIDLSMCKNDPLEKSEILIDLESDIKSIIAVEHDYHSVDMLNTESFDCHTNEGSAELGSKSSDVENIDVSVSNVELPYTVNRDFGCPESNYELENFISSTIKSSDEENIGLSGNNAELPHTVNLDVECFETNYDLENLEYSQTANTVNSDCNILGTKELKSEMQKENIEHSNKSIKENNGRNEQKGFHNILDSNFFKDNVDIIKLTTEQAKCEILLRKESANYKLSKYKCDACYRGFAKKYTFEAHMKKHSLEYGTMKCFACQLNFCDRKALSKHWSYSHIWKISCKSCSFVCHTICQAKYHIKSHKGHKYTCKYCEESFRFLNTLAAHVRRTHITDVVCEFCGSPFATNFGLGFHKKLRHKKEMNERLGPRCDECDVHFASELAWKRHRVLCSRHQVQNGCGVCGETFSDHEELRRHSKKHEEKVMGYKINKGYKINYEKGIKPRSCNLCEKELPCKSAYVKHMKAEHPNAKIDREKMYVCEVCGTTFEHLYMLAEHQHICVDGKPFTCDLCGKSYKRKGNLKQHIRVHTKEMIKCNVCEKAFPDKATLNKHSMRHLDTRPCKCNFCEKTFPYQSDLRSHIKHVHCKEPYPKRKNERKKKTVEKETIE